MAGFEYSELLSYYNDLMELMGRKAPTLAPDVMKVPVINYTDPDRWEREVEMFRTTPVMLAFSVELAEPGSYWAMTRVGVPIILTRLKTGDVRMFINTCRHRGAKVVPDGQGKGARMTCPYHAWTYDLDGKLLSIAEREMFGDIDKNCYGLTELAVEERAGLIWGILTPGLPLDLDEFLGPEMNSLIEKFQLETFQVVNREEMPAANWKLVDEGFRESYHLPFLHANTLGSFMIPYVMKFNSVGLHTHFLTPALGIDKCDPSSFNDLKRHVQISLTMFPSTEISIASDAAFSGRGSDAEPIRKIFSNQVWPGDSPDKSLTISRTLTDTDFIGTPLEKEIRHWSTMSHQLVREEDYPLVQTAQDALKSGGQEHLTIGRNEIGVQHLHRALAMRLGEEPPSPEKQHAVGIV